MNTNTYGTGVIPNSFQPGYIAEGVPITWLNKKANETSIDTNMKIAAGGYGVAITSVIVLYFLFFGKRK